MSQGRIERGYVILYVKGKGTIKRSRHTMEELLGRRLLPSELVHHINKNRQDDRPENLKIMTRGEHNILHTDKGGGGRGKTTECICNVCGIVFKRAPFEIKRGKGKHCSVKCRDISRIKKEEMVCLHCGKTFVTFPSYIKDGRRFCSNACRHGYLAVHGKWDYEGRSKRSTNYRTT